MLRVNIVALTFPCVTKSTICAPTKKHCYIVGMSKAPVTPESRDAVGIQCLIKTMIVMTAYTS